MMLCESEFVVACQVFDRQRVVIHNRRFTAEHGNVNPTAS
jgi:hypothetical protein